MLGRKGENFSVVSVGERVAYPEELREMGRFFLENRETVEDAVEEAACVMGVYADVKPAGVVTNGYEGKEKQEEFEQGLRRLGLEYTMRDIGQGAFQQYFVSKDLEKARELEATFERLWKDEPVDRELGQLLGYPETAVDYVSRGGKNGVTSRDTLIIHSPECFREEYEAYEQRLYEMLDEACPELMEAKRRAEKRGIGKRILGIFKK